MVKINTVINGDFLGSDVLSTLGNVCIKTGIFITVYMLYCSHDGCCIS